MDAIAAVKAQLRPYLEKMLVELEADQNAQGVAYAHGLATALSRVTNEEALLEFFGRDLSVSGPIALSLLFGPGAIWYLDELLRTAQEIAMTFAADSDTAH
jgi:hypothetical protein